MQDGRLILDRDDVRRALTRMAHEIVEANPEGRLALVGIHSRGVPLARRLHAMVEEIGGERLALGEVDITFYRDDIGAPGRLPAPLVNASHLEFTMEGITVVIVDDVLFTGRTVRAAVDALFDYGRPDRVQLAVLVDRGHRELPIRPDYVGKNLPTSLDERVYVRVEERDGVDEVAIATREEALT
jgi:pyrimidine operon attenuation protein/uracil phosphoribosyltransferase